MWPWEHLAFGYVCYSLAVRAADGHRVGDVDLVVLAVATQLPDLVDKPLSWSLGVTTSGYGPVHSLLVGVPVVAVLVGFLLTRRRPAVAGALGVGYGSHLVADALALRAGGPSLGRLLWPLVPRAPYERQLGFAERFGTYLGDFVATVTNPELLYLTGAYVLLFLGVGVLWLADGAPGTRHLRRAIR